MYIDKQSSERSVKKQISNVKLTGSMLISIYFTIDYYM